MAAGADEAGEDLAPAPVEVRQASAAAVSVVARAAVAAALVEAAAAAADWDRMGMGAEDALDADRIMDSSPASATGGAPRPRCRDRYR